MADDPGKKLYDHVFDTYISLRVGMAWVAFAFPLVVVAVGLLFDGGLPVQHSLSAYYWATHGGLNPTRIAFVGGLFALGAFLYLYKGFTVQENSALNAAALCGVGVACFPMAWPESSGGGLSLHGTFAVSLFACLFYVVWFRSGDTLAYLPGDADPAWYRARYRVIAACMAASPLAALAINLTLGDRWFVILVETFGVWSFAAYWWLKGKELGLSHATKRALGMELLPQVPAIVPARAVTPAPAARP